MRPTKIISEWLFATLAGIFVERSTLYVPKGSVVGGQLNLEGVDVKDGNLIGYSVTNGRVYPLATKEDVKTPYVTYDGITINYEVTKEGSAPDSVSFRVLCVERGFGAAVDLADAVEAELNNSYVAEVGSWLTVTSRSSDYDSQTGEFVEELRFSITL